MTLDGIDITGLVWLDEFKHNQIAQERDRNLNGGLIIQEGAKQYGRPITLGEGWLTRSIVEAVYALEAQASTVMSLVLDDGRTFDVVFARAQGFGFEADPIHKYTRDSEEPGWLYAATIRLVTVEPTP